MTDKVLERIKKDAHDFTEGWGENCDVRSFIAGAKSERNQVLDEAINKFKLIEAMKAFKENRMPIPEVIRTLEFLKL